MIQQASAHLDNVPRTELVQDISQVLPVLLDSKRNPGKVERSKATRRDTLCSELTGALERNNVIVSPFQNLGRQAHVIPDLTIELIPIRP